MRKRRRRSSPPSLLSWSFFLFILLAAFNAPVQSLRYYLAPGHKTCFLEHLSGASNNCELRFRFELIEPARYDDIEATIESPSGEHVYVSGLAQNGAYANQAAEDGPYLFCFDSKDAEGVVILFSIEIHVQGLRLLTHFAAGNGVISEPSVPSSVVAIPSASSTSSTSSPPPLVSKSLLQASGVSTMAVLRFDLAAVAEPARLLRAQVDATLRLHIAWASQLDTRCFLHLYPADQRPLIMPEATGGWDEIRWEDGQLAWQNRPLHPLLIQESRCNTNRSVEFSVTRELLSLLSHPPGHRQLTVAISTVAHSALHFHSRSSSATNLHPTLLLQLDADPLHSEIEELSRSLFRFQNSLAYSRMRERVLRDTTENTNALTLLKIVLCLFLVLVSGLQLLFLQSLFDDRKPLTAATSTSASMFAVSGRGVALGSQHVDNYEESPHALKPHAHFTAGGSLANDR